MASRGTSLRKGWPREDTRPVCRVPTPSPQGSGHSFLRALLSHARAAVSPPPSLPDPLQETQGTVVNFAPKGGAIGVPPPQEAKPNCAETWASGPEPQCHGRTPDSAGKGAPATLGGWTPAGRGSRLPAVARAPLCRVPQLRGGFTKPRNRPDGAPGFPTGHAAHRLPGWTERQLGHVGLPRRSSTHRKPGP